MPTIVHPDGQSLRRIVQTGDEMRAGDLELRAGDIRVVIAGSATATDDITVGSIRLASFGREDAEHPLHDVRAMLRDGDHALERIAGAIEPVDDAAGLAVRYRGESRDARGMRYAVTRVFRIDPNAHGVVVTTEVAPAGHSTTVIATLRSGLQTHAASGALFVPGHGLVTRAGSWDAPWAAGVSDGHGWIVTDPVESLHIGAVIEPSDEGDAARATITGAGRAHDGRVTFRSLLLGADGDLADLARLASNVRSPRAIEMPMRVTAHDEIDRSFVVVTRLDGGIVLVADMRGDAVRSIPLPAGEFLAYAFAHGHTTSEAIRFEAHDRAEPLTLEIPEGGRLHLAVRERRSRDSLPSRLVIHGINGTPDPVLGPQYAAAGAGNVVITADGRADFAVPAGEYEVLASHGPEWSIASARVRVTPTARGEANLLLEHVVHIDDWTPCDLHVHSRPSGDSLVAPVDRVASLIAEGVRFAAATEHNTVGDYAGALAELPHTVGTHGELLWVPAVEVTTDRSPHPVGHFNVYPYPGDGTEHGGPPSFVDTPAAIFAAARARTATGVIQVNHPRMEPGIGYFDRVGLDVRTNHATSPLYDPNYDAIEVFNGYFIGAPRDVDRVMHDWFALLSSGTHYVGTANSDSHVIAFNSAGYPRTYVYTPAPRTADVEAPVDAAETVISSLKAGHAFGSSGPMLLARVGEAMPGDSAPIGADETSIPLQIEVRAAPWIAVDKITVYVDGETATEIPVNATTAVERFHHTVSISIPATSAHSFVVVTASGPQGSLEPVLPHVNAVPFAFTNPIWIDRAAPSRLASRRSH